ncbi:hypothetical protein MBANPS3_003633 [Mucor bainieri]
MKASWSTLPAEVLLIVFDHLKRSSSEFLINKYLCQCRLVCKAWNTSATEILFSLEHSLSFGRAQKIKALELRFYGEKDLDVAFQRRFFDLVLTPATVSLTGSLDPTIIAILAELFQANPQNCNKIEQLPTLYDNGFDKNLLKMLLCCKQSLRVIRIGISRTTGSLKPLVNRLCEFQRLERCTLSFEKCSAYVPRMESVLKGCPQITSLFIDAVDGGRTLRNTMEEDECQSWLEQNVKKVDLEVEIDTRISRPDVIQYLAYKYAKIQQLQLHNFDATDIEEVERSLSAVRHIRKLNLHNWYFWHVEELEYFINVMKSKFNKIRLQFNIYKNDHSNFIANARKDSETSTTEFDLDFSRDLEQYMVEQILSLLNIVTAYHLVFYKLDEPFLLARRFDTEGKLNFYESLKFYPDIETLILDVSEIPHQAQHPCNLSSLKNLKNVTIAGSYRMSNTFLNFVEKMAPNLEHLTLKDCRLKSADELDSQHINMANTHFTSLSIITDRGGLASKNNYYTCVNASWEDKELSAKAQALLLQIKIKSSKDFPVQYFLLKPGRTATCVPISQEYYEKHINAWYVMIVECKSLETLRIGLGALAVDMTFKVDGELKQAVNKTIIY